MKFLVLLVLPLLVVGCLLSSTFHPERLTEKQIKELKDSGFDVYTCFHMAGPPPSGSLTTITVPKGVYLAKSFDSLCKGL